MLSIFTGDDTAQAKAKALSLAAGSEVVRFGEGAESFENVLGYLGAQGIFSSKITLILDSPLDTPEGAELFETNLKDFADSDARVIIIQPEFPSALKKKIPKAASVTSFDTKEKDEIPLPSVFSLTDAFVSGDRKKTWILYRQFIEGGTAPEEIHGALSWQVRALVLASKTKSAAESGLKPFVYTKAKRAASRIPQEKAESLSRELVTIYHHARSGGGNMADLLEIFLLK